MNVEGKLIRTALGDDWYALPENIRNRFSENPDIDKPVAYDGNMTEVTTSISGKIFAFFSRILGAPLLPYSGKNVPIDVKVFGETGTDDVIKQRTYHFPGKKPFTVSSRMTLNEKEEFLECVGMGLAMRMDIFAKDDALHFQSTGYSWSCGRFKINIPLFMTPGNAHITHTDIDDDRFRVRIEMVHPWFGTMFLQDGVFKERISLEGNS